MATMLFLFFKKGKKSTSRENFQDVVLPSAELLSVHEKPLMTIYCAVMQHGEAISTPRRKPPWSCDRTGYKQYAAWPLVPPTNPQHQVSHKQVVQFSFQKLPTRHVNWKQGGVDLHPSTYICELKPSSSPPPAHARTVSKSLMQIKVSPSAPRRFWWLIDLACATGWRGLLVWRRAAGTKSEDELKAPWRQTPHGRAATSCPPKLDDALVVTDWQQKLINQTQIVALAAALVITSPTMSHMAHPVPTATN